MVEVSVSPIDQMPVPPYIIKACYVYIYIALEMSEAVVETAGYPHNGFSSCCITEMSKENIQLPPREINMNKCFVADCTASSTS